eukprot:jgi/Tetstr1/444487/TSEL_032368.t1
MWHKVRVTARGGSKKVGYMTICREGVESVAVFQDVHGGPLKARNHKRHAKKALVEARAELHVKRERTWGHDDRQEDIVSTLYPLSLEVKAEPFRGHGSKLKVVKGTVYFHTGVLAAKDTDLQLPTGYSVDPSDPKAWPFLPTFDDPKAYAMRELHALLCKAHFMHLVDPMDDSDALRSVLGWDCSAPIPPPLPKQIGGSIFWCEGPPGESEADKPEREAFWTVHSERARELRERARKLRAKERQERMERESAGTSDSTSECDYSAPRSPHRHSLESYDSSDSWDAANCGPDVKKYYMQRSPKQR